MCLPFTNSIDNSSQNEFALSHLPSLLQPPLDGDDDDQLFNNIMEKPVHYPRGLSDTAKKIIQGVSEIN